jgi:SAM-dependent methyltransferase
VNDHTAANRRHWDELVPVHIASDFYNVASFKAGRTTLTALELEELGDVRGKTMLHLQCHFGMDTLSWAREGAIVTGIDFSAPAIDAARALAAECGIDARFIACDVYDLPDELDERFEIVFTSKGVLFWLPDLSRGANVVVQMLRPGGTFYMFEFHPLLGIFDKPDGVTDLFVRYPYFMPPTPLVFEDDGSYADRSATLVHRHTYTWPHPVSDVITSLIAAGLRIHFFHEFPFTVERFFPFMDEAEEHTFRLTKHDCSVPLMYSVKATKPN